MKIQSAGRFVVAVGKMHVRRVDVMAPAHAVDCAGTHQHVRDLAAIGSGVHAHRAADRARNAAQEFETGKTGIPAGKCDIDVRRDRAGAHIRAVDHDLGEGAAELDRHAVDTAVAHQQIGTDADHAHRHVLGAGREEGLQIVFVFRAEQHVRRTADAEPGQIGQRRVIGDAALETGLVDP